MIAVKRLRAAYPVPFVGMEPAIKPAAATTRSGSIGGLATRASLGSDWFGELRGKYAAGVRILPAVGEGFVEAVERGEENTPAVRRLVHRAVAPLVEAGAGRIVLGCTHYPFLAEVIADEAGAAIEIIDPAPAIARRTASLLDRHGLRAERGHVPVYTFLSAAGVPYAERLRERASRL